MGFEKVDDKLNWMRHHFDILDQAVADYIDLKNVGFAPKRYNDTKTMAWGHLQSIKGPPLTTISHVFGDVLQSANSSLDYLVCELFRRYNPSQPARTCHRFPIVTSHGAFNKEIGSDALFGIPFEVVAVVEGLQPYEGRTDPVPTNLMALRTLTNQHKHRKINVSVLVANPAPSNVAPIEKDGELFVAIRDLPKATHFKAEIGPFPVMKDGQVDMDCKFTPMVVLEESEFRGVLITLTAARLCDAVTECCNRFIPFFV